METITFTLNLAGRVRKEYLGGREYLVAPLTIIVPGVLNGSKGALYYPPDEVARNVLDWDGKDLTVYHPHHLGRDVSVNHPGVRERQGIGFFKNPHLGRGGRLKGEGWFDVEKTARVDNRVLSSLRRGEPIELSTGLYTSNVPAPPGSIHNGQDRDGRSYSRPYQYVARDYRPDHVAILPDQRGACSVQDGCGVFAANRMKDSHLMAEPEVMEPRHEGEECHCKGKCEKCRKKKPAMNSWSWLPLVSEGPVTDEVLAGLEEVAVANRTTCQHCGSAKGYSRCGGICVDCGKEWGLKMNSLPVAVVVNKGKRTPSASLKMSSAKACKILKDGTVHGKPLTERQRGMFGAKCGQRGKVKNATRPAWAAHEFLWGMALNVAAATGEDPGELYESWGGPTAS